MTSIYRPRRIAQSLFIEARGLRHHLRCWGEPDAPLLVMVHGWMDISASFQFVVDCFSRDYRVIAPDWRGFGLSSRPQADCYWYPDYLADLDALLDALLPGRKIDLVGHSMGGSIAMQYAGVRPERIRRLINLEGLGMAKSQPGEAPGRMREWLDELRKGSRLRDYASQEEVAQRLVKTNHRLPIDKARWLSELWSERTPDGRYALLGDPAHKVSNPSPYRVDEVVATWREITAPVLLVNAADDGSRLRLIRSREFGERLMAIRDLRQMQVEDAGHMLHHDQPEKVASLIEEFMHG
ncbi:MAG: alpha/beta hydrolase [Burkholderiales bacterium]|jgi:pimeloyl-ACP methyl ester carboxylesterase|nr:alpha/beta hydrolase [Burkholderiales bacterium]